MLAIIAASMPLIICGAGLATDTIQWTLWKRQLQRAADSAAIAGVYDREAAGGSSPTATAAVTHDLVLNLHTSNALKAGFPAVTFPANSGSATNQVKVTVAIQKPLSFSSFFMATAPTITAVATAASIPAGGDACVQALESSASKTGITNSGNTTIYMPDCVMYSNSPSTNSASAGGSSDVTAMAIAAVGGIQQSNN
ncbi:MAG: pilus assembly protein TadG-related protein [Sphingomicrobium sp.]